MGGISIGGSGHGGKKPVDSEIPLIPFIDLLLCCVMFLLVTAVWNRLGQLSTPLEAPGDPTALAHPPNDVVVTLRLTAAGFELGSTLGDHTEIPREPGLSALRDVLTARRAADRTDVEVALLADDGVTYDRVIEAIDTLADTGFDRVAVRDAL